MAKKRRIQDEVNEQKNITGNLSMPNDSLVQSPSITPDEIESVKNYVPLHLSFKTHILIGIALFLIFGGIFLAYLKTIKYFARNYINEGLNYLQIAEELNKEDTGLIIIYQENSDYQKINELSSNMGRDLSNMFEFIKLKHIPDSYIQMMNETKLLFPVIADIIEKRMNTHFTKLSISFFIERYKKSSANLDKQINELLKLNEEIVKTQNYEKLKNQFLKNIVETKNLYFDLENQTIRLRGLWNRAAAFDAALELFQLAINIDNRNIEAFNNVGYIYELMKEYEMSGERYVHVIKLEPNSALANKIFEKFQNAVSKNPDNIQDRYNLGMAFIRKNMKDKAKEQFNFIISKDPQLNNMLTFMADKRIKEMENPTPEVIYDPRI